jgi:HK97 gp10 family phage protein
MIRAPVDTGRLAGSITWATDKKRSAVEPPATGRDAVDSPKDEWTLHVGTAVEYAPYMEYGTKRTGAQPYLRPALDDNRKRAQDIYAKALQGAIRRHGK